MFRVIVNSVYITLVMALSSSCLWALIITSTQTTWNPSVVFTGSSAAGDGRIGGVESISNSGVYIFNIGDTGSLPTSTIDFCNTPNMTWRVEAYIEYTNGESFDVEVRRDPSAFPTGLGSIASGAPNGTSYKSLSTSPTILFCGQGNVDNIHMQYKIKNIKIDGGSGINPSIIRYNVIGDQ